MYSPLQSLYIEGSAGDPLPTVFKTLEERGTRLLRGQLGLICAGPGTGKSAFALTYALKAGVPTMYFSADSDWTTQVARMVSIHTGWPLAKATQLVRDGGAEAIVAKMDVPIRFNYDASPDIEQIMLSMAAYEEVYGAYPDLAIVDNITNVRAGGSNDDDPFAGLEALMDWLHVMSRQTGACVLGLHHVQGPYNDANKPIPLSGIKGQIGRVPELILTMHRVPTVGAELLNISTVKNRNGRSDPSGQEFASLEFVGDSMQIRDLDGP